MSNVVKNFSLINSLEGYSYLLLLFVAMPLKYMLGIAVAVKIAGMLHGTLFTALVILLYLSWQKTKWNFKENIIFFVASLIPFGTFFTKKRIQSYI